MLYEKLSPCDEGVVLWYYVIQRRIGPQRGCILCYLSSTVLATYFNSMYTALHWAHQLPLAIFLNSIPPPPPPPPHTLTSSPPPCKIFSTHPPPPPPLKKFLSTALTSGTHLYNTQLIVRQAFLCQSYIQYWEEFLDYRWSGPTGTVSMYGESGGLKGRKASDKYRWQGVQSPWEDQRRAWGRQNGRESTCRHVQLACFLNTCTYTHKHTHTHTHTHHTHIWWWDINLGGLRKIIDFSSHDQFWYSISCMPGCAV